MKTKKNPKKPRDLNEALRKSEERFESLIELASEWYWEQDENCRFTLVTGSTPEHSGVDPKNFLGTFRWDRGAVPVGDGGSWDKHKAVLEARQSFTDFVFKRPDSKGGLRYISTSGQPTFDEKKRFTGYRGAARDTTQRVQLDLRLAIEHAVTRVLEESNSIAEAAPRIIRVICETLGWACGTRWEPDEGSEAIRCAETWGFASPGIDAFIEATRRLAPSTQLGGLNRRAWAERKPVWIRDVTKEATFRRAPDAVKAGLHSAFAFPINVGAQVIGVMEFFSREIHQPDAELLDCMTYVGSQIGQFVQRKRAEEEQRRFRAAIDVSADLVFLVDPASMLYIDANETACRALGYSREELLAMGPHDIFSASREDLARLYDRLIAGELSESTAEGWHRRKDGSRLLVESFHRAVPCAKGHIIVAVARDIGERKRAEQLLKLEHTVTRSLAKADSALGAVEAAIRAVCETESWECGRYFRPDEKAGVMRFGVAWGVPDEAIRRYIAGSRDITYPPGVGLMGRVWQSGEPVWVSDLYKDARVSQPTLARESGIHGAFVFPVISEGKTIGVLAFNSREVREPEERLLQAISVIGSQIGQFVQRKQAEDMVREREERFRSLTGLSSDMYWEQDAQFRFTSMSGTGSQRVNVKTVPAIGKKRWEQNYINMTADQWAEHIALLEAHKPFRDMELCRLDETGERIWISISGEPVFDSSGACKGYRGVGKDITGRRRAEQLRELEHAVNRSLADADSASAGLKAVIRAVCETEGWDCGRYFLVDEKAGVLRFSDGWGVEDGAVQRFIAASREITYRPGAGLSGQAWQTGRPLWAADVTKDRRTSSAGGKAGASREIGIHGAFVFPVVADGKTIGVLNFASRKPRKPEDRLLEAISVIGGQIGQFVRRKHDEERIQFLANHDALTSLPNRAMFSEVLNLAIQSARRYNRNFAVLFIDLDRFKNINDTLGHEAGDKLLQEMGARLTQTVRASDVVARLGGDEFVVLVQEVREAKQVATVARKVLSALVMPMVIQRQECRVTASIGICMFPAEAHDEQALMKNADIAMYRAKEDGKNNYKFYSEEMNTHSFERLALESSLRRGLERNEFLLHYQAKLDLHTGKITGVEALVRWQHPEMGLVPPVQFIPLAEETGLIVPLGKWVLNTACAQNVAWQREGLPPLHMAVNLSARQFADDDLVKDIAAALESTGLRPELLELELTESMVIENTERAGRVLAEIKKMGVRLAIDDFGVGYSSLTHLKRFPIDTLKVDRSFIRDLPQNAEDKALTEAIIAMGKSLNLTVVAEGVETQEQQTFLRDRACDEMQGFFFSKPIPSGEFAELLRKHVKG